MQSCYSMQDENFNQEYNFRFMELPENVPGSSLLRSKLVIEEIGAETIDLRNQEDADAVPIMRRLNDGGSSLSTFVKNWSSARYHGA